MRLLALKQPRPAGGKALRVVVLGGSGFVGHSLVPLLRQRHHEVTVLSRQPDLPPRLAAVGARLVRGDLREPAVQGLDLGEVDAMILLAAPRLFGKRLGRRRFLQLKTDITAITSHALDLARRHGCPIIITSGTAFKTSGDQVADESWPLVRFGAARVGEDVDAVVQRIVRAGTPKVVSMMPGQIYGPGGLFMMMFAMARKGRGGVIGDGSNRIPRIHVDDCAAAYAAALEHLDELATGERFIVADDVACTSLEFAERLAELAGAPKPKPAPAFILKLILGKLLVEMAGMDCRVTNAKAKRLLGWAPRYPGFREGLQATVEAINRGEVSP
jgi:nucleoside-diphosphate-sugar epimerase